MAGAFFEMDGSRRSFLKGAASLACVHAAAGARAALALEAGSVYAYVGSYTTAMDGSGNGQGIYRFRMDGRSGELTDGTVAAKTPNPSWIAIHPSKKYLYAINEVNNFNGSSGSVSAFAIDRASGGLTLLNTVSSEGAGPAHMSLDRTGRFALVANYAGGSIAVLPIGVDGRLGPAVDTHRDMDAVGSKHAADGPAGSFAISGHEGPHAHMIAADPQNRFVLNTDLGQDRIYVYGFNGATGKLTPVEGAPFVQMPAGDGPRHFAFHPNGHWFYCLEEESSTIAFFRYDAATGALKAEKRISALPVGFAGTSFGSEIQVSGDGRFLYAANRLHDSICVCAIEADGAPRWMDETWTRGDYPRYFQFAPGGNFLYVCNQRSDAITTFRVDRKTGRLSFTGKYTAAGSPAFITWLV